MSDNKDNNFDSPIVGHEYDGIQEFNNPAPFWWQFSFYLSIVFAIAYAFHYLIGTGMSSDDELSANMAQVQQLQLTNKPKGPSDDDLKALASDANAKAAGKDVYVKNCASCHAPDGGGLIGPNLTDRFWIHGQGDIVGIFKIIRDGAADKGMPPWGPVLKEAELKSVSAYVLSMKDTKPAMAKEPQGTEIK